MKNTIYLLSALLLTSSNLYAQVDNSKSELPKAQVSMLGSFHFSNPGLDTIKTKQMDVSTQESQAYLERLTTKIGEQFTPTQVLLECARNEQGKIDKEYAEYLQGNFTLPINESYQIGFRVAKKANAKSVTCFDEREVQWQAEGMMKVMPENAPVQKRFEMQIKEFTDMSNKMHSSLSLQQILVKYNDPKLNRKNKSLYITTNEVGAGSGFEGADASASWWHRNFRMYANVQKAAQPGEKVLVIAGQGHTSILNDFLNDDQDRDAVDINLYL
ncbi:hypothetical protein GCM10008107_00270 [Psychrosphaera saromensis]|uniref:Haem-binding uptake Tiki superfamily ChaN domain-containing protein n=1 Tax=Psychrosphaera saromensis TaxID=716813 RepID=A0A2S7UYC2_9GAMM|nr:DUF5694 domain-containing protein [Psychrosphaera saromensis]PQJ54994.1 hypothetical protein BTO11_15915 [Psychrosphaera saromensis]GHB55516.1 hypothetical protein GCM10008107_00270 [Psychrosphaera saromensis]GLQ13749.1 hypothetical protein GCM10007917_12040 [Psychrosphaera saromensis]